MRRILVIDDEPQITRMLRTSLQVGGYAVETAANGREGFQKFEISQPDLVITDLAMPEMDGLELTRAIRRVADTPVIVLSVRGGEAMKVTALDDGADDYLTKPFSMPELLARVRVHLRKAPANLPPNAKIAIGDFVVDTDAHTVVVAGAPVHLTPKEFDLLVLFARRPERALTHKVLLSGVWGRAGEDQPEYLRVLVAQLRRKIESGPTPRYVVSEPWVGYRFHPAGDGGKLTDS